MALPNKPHKAKTYLSGLAKLSRPLEVMASMASVSASGTASHHFMGSEIDDIRDKVSLSPSVLAETLDMVYSSPPSVSKTLIDGKYQNVYTYKGDAHGEASFVSMSKKVDIPVILETAKKIADYADRNGTMKETPDGFLAEVETNDYLRYLGYTPKANGGFGIKDKRKVWGDLKQVFETPVKRAVRFKSGDKVETLVFEAPIIQYAVIFEGDDTKRALALNSDKPPTTFLVGIVPAVAKQMTGFKDISGQYFHPSLAVEPRRKAKDYKHEITGYKLALSNRLFMLFRQAVKPIRRYSVKDLTEVIGGRDRDRVRKLVKALNTFEKRGEITAWGFCNSRNKTYNKTETKAKMVIIDHQDTPVFNKNISLFKSKKSDLAKMREEVKRLNREQKKTNRKVSKIEKEL